MDNAQKQKGRISMRPLVIALALPVVPRPRGLAGVGTAAWALCVLALGLYLGHRITLRMERQRFMQVLYGVLLCTGASLILRALA